MLRLPLITLIAVSAGCQQPVNNDAPPDAGEHPVHLHGRVVDFETCSDSNGCRAVEGVKVRLLSQPTYASEPTTAPGRFELPVPRLTEGDALVAPDITSYAQTINPWAVPAAISDVYGLELFAMPTGILGDGSPTILTALTQLEPPIQLLDSGGISGEGGYIGQVLRLDEDGRHAVQGATVEIILASDWPPGIPEPEVRYLRTVPRYVTDELLFEAGYPSTGPFGIFIVATRQQSVVITIHVETADTIFSDVVASVEPGMVTVGLHLP